jgi:hypothetical protein
MQIISKLFAERTTYTIRISKYYRAAIGKAYLYFSIGVPQLIFKMSDRWPPISI